MPPEPLILELPPQVETSIDARFEYLGRMRQLLMDEEKSKRDQSDYRAWRTSYFFPVISAIAVAEGVGEIAARTGNFPGNKPQWFDADPERWADKKIDFPPGLIGKGHRRTYVLRLGERVKFIDRKDEDAFGLAMAETKRACQTAVQWDDKMIWPVLEGG